MAMIDTKIKLANMAMVACLFTNDLKHIHLHATGERFDTIHGVCNELYEEANSEIDWFSERALSLGMEIPNFADAKEKVVAWKPIEDSKINWGMFVDYLDDIGNVYIGMLKNTKAENSGDQSVIDGYIDYWNKAITYKNAARKNN